MKEEENIIEMSRNALDTVFGSQQEALDYMAKKAKEGSYQYMKLLLEYAFGRPTDKVHIQSKDEQGLTIIVKSVGPEDLNDNHRKRYLFPKHLEEKED